MRLVSSEFNKLAADHLFKSLRVDTGWPPQYHCGRDLWKALADGTTSLGTSVRKIHITLDCANDVHSQKQLRESIYQQMELLELIAHAIPRLLLLAEPMCVFSHILDTLKWL